MTEKFKTKRKKFILDFNKLSPMQIILFSFMIVIAVGGALLYLPISHAENIDLSFFDCLFTSAAAVSVTGLTVVHTASSWSLFGKIIILVLIQIGGLSMITITSFIAIALGKKIGFKNRLLIQSSLSQNQFGGMVSMTKTIVKGAAFFEIGGTIILTLYFFIFKNMPFLQSFQFGIFHSVSAFCNSGFDILGGGGMRDYSNDYVVNIVLIIILIAGEIGFIAWQDIYTKIKNPKHRFNLTTRLAIIMTGGLIISGAIYFFFAEYSNPRTLGAFSLPHKILASFFQSVSLRTAGFDTIHQQGMREVSKFVSSIFMMVGGAPGGMSGGIKTVTVAVILSSIWSIIKGREGVQIMRRSISLKTLQNALAVTGIMISLLFAFSVTLSVTEAKSEFQHTFIDILYECSSALGTAGMSVGLTPHLSGIGRIIIGISMFIGRVGPITVIYGLSKPRPQNYIKYPTAEVLIG